MPLSADYVGPRLTLLIAAIWLLGLGIGFIPALAVLTALGYVAALVGIVRPVVGLLGVGMLCAINFPTRAYLMTGGLLRWNMLDYWLILSALLALPFLLRQDDVLTWIIRLFLGLLSLETLYSPDPTVGFLQIMAMATVAGMSIYFTRAARDRRVWYWLAVVTGTLTALGGAVYWFQHDALPYLDPNAWAYFPFTALYSLCTAAAFGELKIRERLLLQLLAVPNVTWILLTGSRGVLLLVAVCVIYLICKTPGRFRKLVWTLAAVLIGCALTIPFSGRVEHSWDRISLLLNKDKSLGSRTSGRSNLALDAWHIFLDRPLVGAGTGGFARTRIESRHATNRRHAFRERASHSVWMATLAENGLPGISLLGMYILSFAIVGWQRRSHGMFSFGLTVTAVLGFAFLSSGPSNSTLWFVAAGATALLGKKECRASVPRERTPPHILESSCPAGGIEFGVWAP